MDYSLLLAIESQASEIPKLETKMEQIMRERSQFKSKGRLAEKLNEPHDPFAVARPISPTFRDFAHSFKRKVNPLLTDKIVHVGIIDYLQTWNLSKKVENYAKTHKFSKTDISAVEPSRYRKRFVSFMSSHVFRQTEEISQSELFKWA
jgi:hypothetical protein